MLTWLFLVILLGAKFCLFLHFWRGVWELWYFSVPYEMRQMWYFLSPSPRPPFASFPLLARVSLRTSLCEGWHHTGQRVAIFSGVNVFQLCGLSVYNRPVSRRISKRNTAQNDKAAATCTRPTEFWWVCTCYMKQVNYLYKRQTHTSLLTGNTSAN